MFTLVTQEYASSLPESRIVESLAFAHATAERGGFYKVQIIDNESGCIVLEAKA
jgi:hypothetical protein